MNVEKTVGYSWPLLAEARYFFSLAGGINAISLA
jgi:hypothetical protein